MNSKPSTTLLVPHHFHGPPDSGNGGYTCGLIAEALDFTPQITLRKPIPLNSPLQLSQQADGSYQLLQEQDNSLVSSIAVAGDFLLEVPEAISFEAATAASQQYLGHRAVLAYPSCFVCGVQRAAGEGLHIYAGSVPNSAYYAAPWVPATQLATTDGFIPPRYIWAALDCPGAYAAMGKTVKNLLLGRMSAQKYHPLLAGQQSVLMAWLMAQEGRKYHTGTALYDDQGRCLAKALATWIEVVG